jgi:hypothetical protein
MPFRQSMGRLSQFIGAVLTLVVGTVDIAFAQSGLSGRSADLGFTFVTPEVNWCGDIVRIELSANDAGTFERDTRALEQALGRLRAAATAPSECPRAQTIKIDAKVNGTAVRRATMSAFSRWIIVWEDIPSGSVLCFDTEDRQACRPYAAAFEFWRDIAASKAAPPFQLTSFLETQRGTQAEWTADGLVGQLRVLPVSAIESETNAERIVDAIVSNAADACGKSWQLLLKTKVSEQLSRADIRCNSGNRAGSESLIILAKASYYYIFSMRGVGRDSKRLFSFASALAKSGDL